MAAEITVASTRKWVTSMPTDIASGSFSRKAIIARPARELTRRRMIIQQTTATARTSQKNCGLRRNDSSSGPSHSRSAGMLLSAIGPWVSSTQLSATSRTTSAKLIETMTK